MGPKTEALNFRIESNIADRLRRLAEQTHRSLADELRAGIEIYLLLIEMTNLRANRDIDSIKARDFERAVKDEIGRIFLVALSPDAENAFEDDLDVEYPRDSFKEIAVPFDKLIDWVVAGRPVSDQELAAEARHWLNSSPVIRADNRPATHVLRTWARALEAIGDESATLSRVQQALRLT